MSDKICGICFTSSWEPCEKDDKGAIRDNTTNGWMRCGYCFLQEKYILLADALRELIEWMDNAPFDYSNGNEAQGIDEGNVYGWRSHKILVNKAKRLLGIPVSELDQLGESLGKTKLPDDDFPF